MRIGITLDDVIRAKTKQIGKIYKKYIDNNIDLDALDLSSGDMYKILNFKSKNDYIDFLYESYPFEIFSEASVTEASIDKNLNLWHLSLNDDENIDEEIELILLNPMEFNASIGYTYFFISKIASRIREVYLPKNYSDIWDKCDVLITADKKLLANKPENKISVKIDMPYNVNINADYSYEKLSDLLKDKTFLTKIISSKNNL